MGKSHKKAALLAVLAAAALAGTVFALSPAWERHRCEEKQEAMLSRLELSVPEIQAFEEPLETVKAASVTAVSVDKAPETAAEPEREKISETGEKQETERGDEAAVKPLTAKRPEGDMPQAGAEIGILSIPKIDARLPVTAGVSEEQLKISEGWVMQTALIGSGGNAVIAGHRSYTYGKHFNRLGELEAGDEIFYTAVDGTEMCFAVSEILTVLPDDPAVFDAPPEGASQLTLYTCTPVKVATHRLLVRALRVEE